MYDIQSTYKSFLQYQTCMTKKRTDGIFSSMLHGEK